MDKFRGKLDDLQTLVSDSGYTGQWREDDGKTVFRSEDGAVLNWWHSTGTVQFQGPREAREALEDAISNLSSGSLPSNAASDSELAKLTPDASPQTVPIGPLSTEAAESGKVFVVYGHDGPACEQLELVLRRLKLEPFVLGNTSGGGLTIIEALEQEIMSPATGNRFGIVLLTPDDMGYQRTDKPETAEPRARQNVVMEMGMLIAAFGRKRVAILKKGHLEIPSDASGIIYLPFNSHVKETAPKLCDRLEQAGFQLSPNLIALASA